MLLNEYAAKMGFTCETECKRLWQDGNSSGVARFVARVKLCGHLVAEEEGFSKQEASNKASVAAMGGVMEEAPSDWGQSMRSLIMGKFAELLRPETRSIVFPTVCAGIVCSMPGREPFVVSLGAGTVHVPLVERGEFPSEVTLQKRTSLISLYDFLSARVQSRWVRLVRSLFCLRAQTEQNQTQAAAASSRPEGGEREAEPANPPKIILGAFLARSLPLDAHSAPFRLCARRSFTTVMQRCFAREAFDPTSCSSSTSLRRATSRASLQSALRA